MDINFDKTVTIRFLDQTLKNVQNNQSKEPISKMNHENN